MPNPVARALERLVFAARDGALKLALPLINSRVAARGLSGAGRPRLWRGSPPEARPLRPRRAEGAGAGPAVLLWRKLAERLQGDLPRLGPGLRQPRHRHRGRRLPALSAGQIPRLRRGRRAGLSLPARTGGRGGRRSGPHRRQRPFRRRLYRRDAGGESELSESGGPFARRDPRRHRSGRALRLPAALRSGADRHFRRRPRDGDAADQARRARRAAHAAGARHQGHHGRRRQFATVRAAPGSPPATRSS